MIVFQRIARTLAWVGIKHTPAAMVSYSEHSRLRLPAAAIRLIAPVIARVEARLHHASDGVARSELRALPAELDKVDAWIADGTIGDPQHPNAADLQLASTIRLLLTFADVLPLLEGRPCAELAMRLFPKTDGELPTGSLPAA